MRVVKWVAFMGIMGLIVMAVPWNLPGLIVICASALVLIPNN